MLRFGSSAMQTMDLCSSSTGVPDEWSEKDSMS